MLQFIALIAWIVFIEHKRNFEMIECLKITLSVALDRETKLRTWKTKIHNQLNLGEINLVQNDNENAHDKESIFFKC